MVVGCWVRRLGRAVKRFPVSRRLNANDLEHGHVPSLIAACRSRIRLRLLTAPVHLREAATRWVPAFVRILPASPEKARRGDIHQEGSRHEDAPIPVPPGLSHPADRQRTAGVAAEVQEPADAEHPGEAAENEDTKAESKESKRWELIIAASIAVAAVTGAALTYLALREESAAVESDRESVVQTVIVQNQDVAAKIQVDASDVLAARYRQLMAEASVLSTTDGNQAILARLDAAGFIANLGVSDYLNGTGATARYDDSAALQGALAVDATAASLPPDEPALTAGTAARDYALSRRIRISIVGLLVIVVLLTIARLSKTKKRRQYLFAAATLGYAVATVAAIIQVA